MTYQVRTDGRHNTYMAYEFKGEIYSADGNVLNAYRLFDKVLFEGNQKEAYKYYLENIVLNGEPL